MTTLAVMASPLQLCFGMDLFVAFLIIGIVVLAVAILFAVKRRDTLGHTFDTAPRKSVIHPLDEEPV